MAVSYPNAMIIGNPTTTYNCHAYAWYVSEGGTPPVWMGLTTNPTPIYWNDGSYVETTERGNGLKVSYDNLPYNGNDMDNHSAITTAENGIFISKWGAYPLVRHTKDYTPYTYSSLHYFKKNTPPLSLSGSATLCLNSSATYTINNFPPNATVTWSQSSNLQPVSGSGASKVYKGIANGAGWIEATVNGITASRFNVWVGPPQITSVTGPTKIRAGGPATFTCDYAGGESIIWKALGGSPTIYIYPDMHSADLVYLYNGTWNVTAKVTNQCGSQSQTQSITVTGGYDNNGPPCLTCPDVGLYSSAYPNPAGNILNIEIDGEAGAQTKSMEEQTITGSKTIRQDVTYDVRLYDGMGTLLRRATVKSGKVEFDVSNLADGIYYLHIYDGINEKPEMTQIIVQH
ncbi:MAG: T9SS type A sorting domain-containing protein [Candidatus Azobacteroides sp.]|nr:T9SS type A sorting domain-containing protein [Candidatus Azobacteroides sp.]